MSPDDKIAKLKAALIESRALQLNFFKRWQGEEDARAWEELSAEEQESQLWYQEYLLSKEMPEIFTDV